MKLSSLVQQKEALEYLLKYVDTTEKDRQIHREALKQIEELLKERVK